MQILCLEYKYLAFRICKYIAEDCTSKRLTLNSCPFLNNDNHNINNDNNNDNNNNKNNNNNK